MLLNNQVDHYKSELHRLKNLATGKLDQYQQLVRSFESDFGKMKVMKTREGRSITSVISISEI